VARRERGVTWGLSLLLVSDEFLIPFRGLYAALCADDSSTTLTHSPCPILWGPQTGCFLFFSSLINHRAVIWLHLEKEYFDLRTTFLL
jgi:hypothetical protein